MSFRIGFHDGAGGNSTGIGDYFKRLDEAGVPAIFKSTDEYGPVGELVELAKISGVDHRMMYRSTTAGQDDGFDYDVPDYSLEPLAAAFKHWRATVDVLPPEFDKELVWLEVINEVDKNRGDWLGRFGVAIANLAMADGYKISLFGWSLGEPEVDAWETPGMLAFLTLASLHPNKLAISVHEYSNDSEDLTIGSPWLVGRYRFLLDVLRDNRIERPRIFVTEHGWTYNDIPDNAGEALAQLEWANGEFYDPDDVYAFLWYLGGVYGSIANKVQPLIAPITELSLRHGPPTEPELPVGAHKAIVVKAPQEVDREDWNEISDQSYKNRHTQTASHDDMLTLLGGGNAESFAKVYEPQLPSQKEAISFLDASGHRWEPRWISGVPPAASLLFDAWPTDHRVVTRHFGVRKDIYLRFGLPGHGGIDVRGPMSSNVYAVLPGTIAEIRYSPDGLGHNVRIDHSNDRQTTYGHLQEILVAVGDVVAAGELIALADNSGFSGASHLHLMLKDFRSTYVDKNGVSWPYNIHDPSPYIRHLAPDQFIDPGEPPPPPVGSTIDLLPYLAGVLSGRTALYELQMINADGTSGPQERVQAQWENDRFYITKGNEIKANWEERWLDGELIYFGTDTSESESRYYTQRFEGAYGAPWAKQKMAVGEWFLRNPNVTHYLKDGCVPKVSGDVASYLGLAAVYPTYTFDSGIVLQDVIELVWSWSPSGDAIERYLFAKNRSLVGWFSNDGRRSYVSELHDPGARPDNKKELISCL